MSVERARSITIPDQVQPILVLIADDDDTVVQTIGTALRRAGFAVALAHDGREALALAAEQPPDLAMIDLQMPHVDGFEVIRQLKADAPTRPVLAVSGNGELDSRCGAFDAGADDFIEKPYYLREVLMRVEAHARTHRTNQELKRLGEQADHMRVLAAEAAALLAHDLNNGLAVVKANLEYLTDCVVQTPSYDEEAADSAAGAKRALSKMITLVRNFVDIARMEDAVLKPARADVTVAEVISSVAEIHQPRKAISALGLELAIPDGLKAHVDPVLLERILHNLLNNSMRYVNKNGRVRVTAGLDDDVRGQSLIVTVSNTGPAIPSELRATLFDKYTVGQDRKAQSGMGLYFCRLASEAHGGSIALIDDPDFATCFRVSLPVSERNRVSLSPHYRTGNNPLIENLPDVIQQ